MSRSRNPMCAKELWGNQQNFNNQSTKNKQVFNSPFGGELTGQLGGAQPFFQKQPGTVAHQA